MGENNLEIVGGRIEFNCVDNYRTLSIVNETPAAGSVSGAGVYYPVLVSQSPRHQAVVMSFKGGMTRLEH